MGRFYPYSTDSDERQKLPFYFAVVAIGVASLVHVVVERVHPNIPWYVDLPWSPLALYGVFQQVFSRVMWRWEVFHRLGLVKIPNVNGRYEGWFTTSFDQHGQKQRCHLSISQTWTSISITGRFNESDSYNMVTGVSVVDRTTPRLMYEYRNDPKADANQGMQSHVGTVQFTVDLEKDVTLEGSYYNGRGRETFGRIEVKRIATSS